MKQVVIVSATQSKTLEEFYNRPLYKSLYKLDLLYSDGQKLFDFKISKDNKTGLSKVYNSYLNNLEHKNKILLFVHDDVEINDFYLVEKLNESPYVVTGLAGAKKIDLNKPSAWHLMSNREDWVGEVTHFADGQEWTSVFGPSKSRALVIDGLFIAVDVDKAFEKGLNFDEDFDFHHYDLSFCLHCNEKKASVGVLPIKVTHHGLGDSMNTPEWHSSATKFREKFNK